MSSDEIMPCWHRRAELMSRLIVKDERVTVSVADVRALQHEAGEAGDMGTVAVCDRAIYDYDDADAWAECLRIIMDARAQEWEEAGSDE